ncbi:hypothetical protein ACO0LG_07560 [Undibacterium sp. Ji42W]|uniref:hypothetical protein n=1 Tax=Undibacterium sp. Ji42W TaxID=3413039 RepID=UPI003BF0D3ED
MQIYREAEVGQPTVPLVEYQECTNEDISPLPAAPATTATMASKAKQPSMPDWY